MITSTERGTLQVKITVRLIAVISEKSSYKCSSSSQNIYLGIPKKESELPMRNKLTRVGEFKKTKLLALRGILELDTTTFRQKLL